MKFCLTRGVFNAKNASRKLEPLWSRMGIPLPEKPVKPAFVDNSDSSHIHLSGKATISVPQETPSRSGSDVDHLLTRQPVPRSTEEIQHAMGWDRQRSGRAAALLAQRAKEAA